jgi:hypothetical protein
VQSGSEEQACKAGHCCASQSKDIVCSDILKKRNDISSVPINTTAISNIQKNTQYPATLTYLWIIDAHLKISLLP